MSVFCVLCSVQTVNGMHLFTTTGYKYFRSFQISLCAGADDFPPATCLNNASLEMQVRYAVVLNEAELPRPRPEGRDQGRGRGRDPGQRYNDKMSYKFSGVNKATTTEAKAEAKCLRPRPKPR